MQKLQGEVKKQLAISCNRKAYSAKSPENGTTCNITESRDMKDVDELEYPGFFQQIRELQARGLLTAEQGKKLCERALCKLQNTPQILFGNDGGSPRKLFVLVAEMLASSPDKTSRWQKVELLTCNHL